MAGTDWVEELDGADVEPPKTPAPKPKVDDAVKPDPSAPAGSEAEVAAEKAYAETIKGAGV
jgi:hypothetical protein